MQSISSSFAIAAAHSVAIAGKSEGTAGRTVRDPSEAPVCVIFLNVAHFGGKAVVWGFSFKVSCLQTSTAIEAKYISTGTHLPPVCKASQQGFHGKAATVAVAGKRGATDVPVQSSLNCPNPIFRLSIDDLLIDGPIISIEFGGAKTTVLSSI